MSDTPPTPEQIIKNTFKPLSNPLKIVPLIRQIMELVNVVGLVLMTIFTYPVELLLHRRHGLRLLCNRNLISGLAMLGLVTGSRISFVGSSIPARWLVWIILGGIALHVLRRRRAWKRHLDGEEVHSRSTSDPVGPWSRIPMMDDEWRILKYGEPLLLICIGLVLRAGLGMSLGSYLLIAALALHCKIKLFEERELARVLDEIDQRLEHEHFRDAIEQRQRPEAEKSGWIVPIPVPESMRQAWAKGLSIDGDPLSQTEPDTTRHHAAS